MPFEDVRTLLVSRIDLAPKFRKRVMEVPGKISRPVWVDDERFDVDSHVRRVRLPSPGSRTRASEYSLNAPNRWQAQLIAYQIMPTDELLIAQPVELTISLGGGATASTTTDASGRYGFTGLANGTYVVTPTLAGYTFAPASRTVIIDGSDEVLGPFAAQLATWELVASGTSSVLRAVWGSSPQDVWIVGDGPILHWDGTSMTTFVNPTGRSLHAVWGASATDVWAVGDASIVHWDGSSWTRPSSGLAMDIELRGLWGSSASDIWAIGVDPWHYDGAQWSRGAAPLPKQHSSDELDGIWGSAPNDIWVVGDDVDRFDGSRWGLYLYDCDLHGVWGTSSSNIWAVGDLIAHYDGRRWSGAAAAWPAAPPGRCAPPGAWLRPPPRLSGCAARSTPPDVSMTHGVNSTPATSSRYFSL